MGIFDDLADLMNDPDFARPYTVIRTTGARVEGEFVLDEPQRIPFYGPVQPASVRELEQLPEGERQKGIMKFMCKNPAELYLTQEASGMQKGCVSDEVEWNGYRYKIIQVMPWTHYGWMRAFGVMSGRCAR